MKPLKRSFVHKGRSSKQFSKNHSRTKAINVNSPRPMRGGFRL